MTVQGPLPVGEMGVTLDARAHPARWRESWKCPCHPGRACHRRAAGHHRDHRRTAHEPLHQPGQCLARRHRSCAQSELKRFQALGGHTVVDPTNFGIGRDPVKLRAFRRMAGLKIVMGSGFYLQHTHPEWLKDMDVDAVTEFIVNDVGGGETPARDHGRHYRRSRRQQGFHRRGAEIPARLGTRFPHHRRAAVDPPARLGAAGQ